MLVHTEEIAMYSTSEDVTVQLWHPLEAQPLQYAARTGICFLMHGSGGGGRWGRIDVSYRRLGTIESEICEGEKDGVMFKGLSRSATGPAPHDAGDTI